MCEQRPSEAGELRPLADNVGPNLCAHEPLLTAARLKVLLAGHALHARQGIVVGA